MELYMTNSKGKILHYGQKQPFSLKRQKELLENFRGFLIKCLVKTGIQTEASYFDIMIQPHGTYDGLLYFSKIPVDSSDRILRKKISLDNHEYTPQTQNEKNYLNSIFEVRENGKPCWYVLQVNRILLERNTFDNAWITVSTDSFPYYQLRSDWNKIAYKKGVNESPDSFGIIAGKNYADIKTLIQNSFKDDSLHKQAEQILDYYHAKGLHGCDKYSNQKTLFLSDLYDTQPTAEEVYHAFEITRIFLKRQTGTKAHLHYKGNNLIWTFHGAELYIHVCHQEKYNIGGIFYHEDQLKEQIKNIVNGRPDISQKEWYQSLLPFLAEQNTTRKGRNV